MFEKWKKKIIQEYLDSIEPIDKSVKERHNYMVDVSGVEINTTVTPPEEVPYTDSHFFEDAELAERFGKAKYQEGSSVEIWKLLKRWI